MMVLRRWPAWNFFAILGLENSTMTVFDPSSRLLGSRSPRFRFAPNASPRRITSGMRFGRSFSGSIQNRTAIPLTSALRSLDASNWNNYQLVSNLFLKC